MNRKIVIFLSVALFAGLGLWGYNALNSGSTGGSGNVFATKPPYVTVLKTPQTGENVRVVALAPDGIKTKFMRIEFRDGRTGIVNFDDNGKAVGMVEYFALTPEELQARAKAAPAVVSDPIHNALAGRKILRVTEADKDGKTIKIQRTYREDGSVADVAVLSKNGDLVVSAFRETGSGVERIKVYSRARKGALVSEQVFRPDGTGFAEILTAPSSYETRRDFFDAEGKRYRTMTYSYWSVEIADYWPDAKTKKESTTYNSSGGVSVTSYDQNGRLLMEKAYYDGGNVVSVRFYDTSSRTSYMQRWVKLDPALNLPEDRVSATSDGYVLDQVTEYFDSSWSTKRELNFYPGGKIVKMSETRKATVQRWGTYTRKFYRDDGSLDKTEEYEAGSVKSTVPMPAGPNSDREVVAPNLLKAQPFAPVPGTGAGGPPKPEVRPLTLGLE